MSEHPLGTSRTVLTRDGRSLHAMVKGESAPGVPTILFEAGLAAPRSYWGLVVPEVARRARVIVYDRAGLGRSETDTAPRTVSRMADDLDDLLDSLEVTSVLLVAHSGGALVVRETAARRPDRVAGMVLVDPSDEGCDPVFSRSFRLMEKFVHHASCLLARIGLLGRLFDKQLAPLATLLRAEFRAEAFTNGAMQTRGTELRGMIETMNAWRHRPATSVDFPVTVISGAKADPGMSTTLRAAFNASHARRTSLSSYGRHVLAEHSGHFIPLTEPEIIVSEIKNLVETLEPSHTQDQDLSI